MHSLIQQMFIKHLFVSLVLFYALGLDGACLYEADIPEGK